MHILINKEFICSSCLEYLYKVKKSAEKYHIAKCAYQNTFIYTSINMK